MKIKGHKWARNDQQKLVKLTRFIMLLVRHGLNHFLYVYFCVFLNSIKEEVVRILNLVNFVNPSGASRRDRNLLTTRELGSMLQNNTNAIFN